MIYGISVLNKRKVIDNVCRRVVYLKEGIFGESGPFASIHKRHGSIGRTTLDMVAVAHFDLIEGYYDKRTRALACIRPARKLKQKQERYSDSEREPELITLGDLAYKLTEQNGLVVAQAMLGRGEGECVVFYALGGVLEGFERSDGKEMHVDEVKEIARSAWRL